MAASPQVGVSRLLEIDKIRQLVDMMVANDLVEISLRDGDVEVSLRRPTAPGGEVVPVVTGAVAVPNPGAGANVVVSTPEAPVAEESAELVNIESPMVGTFYSASDPE
jgi:acetyl-CoA carboxylase biotin carboxyl carrier protein